MRDEGAAEGAGCVCRPVLGDGAETRLAENVAAGLTAVRAEVDVEAHGAVEALSVLLLAVRRQTAGFLSLNTQPRTHKRTHSCFMPEELAFYFNEVCYSWETYEPCRTSPGPGLRNTGLIQRSLSSHHSPSQFIYGFPSKILKWRKNRKKTNKHPIVQIFLNGAVKELNV